MKQYLDFVTRIARRYTLPAQCAITRDDLIQEACLALLETPRKLENSGSSPSPSTGSQTKPVSWGVFGEDRGEASVYAIARKAMQRAISRYLSPVTRSLDETLYKDDNGNPITLADTIADDSADTDSLLALSDSSFAFLSSLDAQLTAGTITPTNYRQKKHRFLKKLRRQVSQNRFSPV